MARAIDSEVAFRFLTEQLVKETGAFSKGVNKGLNIARSAIRNPDAIPTLTPPNEPLIQADLDSMDYDKVWIDYEDDTGDWALVCNGYIYSIDALEGAGLDFVDYMRGERLEPHGYKVYRFQPEGETNA